MLFKHSVIYILAKAIPGLMAFAALSVYTHLLTPDEYGLYTLIFTAAVFMHSVIFNWLPSGTLRFWSSQDFSDKTFISTLATTYIKILSILFTLVLILTVMYRGQPVSMWIFSAFLLLSALAAYTISQNLLAAQVLPLKYAKLTIIYSVLSIFFGSSFAYMGFGATGVVFGITLGLFIPTLLLTFDIWKTYDRNQYDQDLFKKILKYGIPISGAFILEELTKSADRFMLAAMQDKAQAGLYAVGYDLSGNSILLIMSAINLAAYPVVIKLLDNEGKEAALDYFRKYVILLIGVALPSVVGLILVGPDLVHLVVGEEYQEAVIFLLPWITVGLFLMGLESTYFALAFQLGQYTIGMVKVGVIITLINLGLNFWLIPKMGIQGAAIATLSSFGIGVLISSYYGRKYFPLPFPVKEFSIIVAATLFMGFCLWWLKEFRGWGWLLLQLTVGLFSYATVIYYFNLLDIRNLIKDKLIKQN